MEGQGGGILRCRERFRAALFTEVDLTILQESARERDLLGVAG